MEHIAPRVDATGPLATHAARGFVSIVTGRLVSQVAQFLASIVLARLLLPSDYGLVAVTWTITGFAGLFSDLGLGAALVQTPRLTERDATTAFVINEIAGVALTLTIVVLRQPLADLLGQPRVAPLLALASLTFTLSLNVVPYAILERQLQFRKIAAIDIGSATVGLAVSVACASQGVGAESLVIGPLTTAVILSVASLMTARWVPKAWPRWSSARALLGFSGHMTGYNVLGYWARNADNLLLGRFAGPTQLGLYTRAYMLMLLPLVQVGSVLGRVLLPLLSSMQDDLARLRQATIRVARTTSLLVFPVLLGLAAVAHNFVLVAFGPHRRPAIPLVEILAIAGLPRDMRPSFGAGLPGCRPAAAALHLGRSVESHRVGSHRGRPPLGREGSSDRAGNPRLVGDADRDDARAKDDPGLGHVRWPELEHARLSRA